jgi:hypothetical protein
MNMIWLSVILTFMAFAASAWACILLYTVSRPKAGSPPLDRASAAASTPIATVPAAFETVARIGSPVANAADATQARTSQAATVSQALPQPGRPQQKFFFSEQPKHRSSPAGISPNQH